MREEKTGGGEGKGKETRRKPDYDLINGQRTII